MIIVLNGPLGIGKSTLAEVLSERIDRCAMLDGDCLAMVNPPPADAVEHLHQAIVLLMEHHGRFGYRHFVVNHLWETHSDLADLCHRLARFDSRVFCYRLTLDRASNMARIARRAGARAIDENDHEAATFARESGLLDKAVGDGLGEPFDVSGPPEQLADALLARLGASPW
jgi:hypothetical protein